MTVTVKRETPDQLAVLDFLAQADARSASLYPAESRHSVPVAALQVRPEVSSSSRPNKVVCNVSS